MPSIAIEEIGISPSILKVSETFSENFCIFINNGLSPEKAGESAAKKMARGLIFSPVISEIMEAPKESIASTLSQNIFSRCGESIGVTEQELNDYIVQLAKNVPTKSNRNFPMGR